VDKKIIHNYGSEIFQLKSSFKKDESVTLNVTLSDGSGSRVTFDCNKFSGSLISHSISLAKKSGDDTIALWDINDIVNTYTLDEAEDISDAITLNYLNRIMGRQEKITRMSLK
jgi:hypothetical protein